MDEMDLTDSWHVLPGGFNASRVTEPPTTPASEPAAVITKANAAEEAFRAITDAQRRLGTIGLAVDMLGIPPKDAPAGVDARLSDHAASELAHVRDRLRTALRAVGLLVPALLVAVGLAVGGPSVGRAEAAEGPQPDPVASATYRVTLGARPVLVNVRATVYTGVAPGWFCASVWSPRGMLGRRCSASPTFTVPVSIDPRAFPVGRTFAQVVDDGTDTTVANVILDARRPSRFGAGYYEDRGQGDLYARVPVSLYSPVLGRWVGQSQSPVRIQELTRRGWRTRATLTTNPPGLAVGVVHLGGGLHVIRAVRPDGATVWGTTGRNRLVTITTEPLDII